MAGILPFQRKAAREEPRPVLHLSGPRLAEALERLIAACEPQGGAERLAQAVALKAALFRDTLGGAATAPTLAAFEQLCAFMPTCRRRIGAAIRARGFAHLAEAMAELLDGATDPTTADARMAAFARRFPEDKAHRWVRDLAAELLHNTWPEQYPLMTRWVWDARANTGVLREIWHGDNVDHMVIEAADDHATFVVLREELSQFLADNGVFRDMPFYVDMLQAQVYAGYIDAQGGAYLRTDFNVGADPLAHVRRMLGLDGIDARTGRSRLKTIDGEARETGAARLLS